MKLSYEEHRTLSLTWMELNYGVSKELAGKGLSTARKKPKRDKHCA